MASTIGEKEIQTDWPHETGLGADDKHDGRQINLVPEEGSLVPRRKKVGLDGKTA